jgi:hypothetical protein
MDTTAAEKDAAKDKKMATVKEESEDDEDIGEMDMDAFLREGGFEEDKKKRKKEEEAANNDVDVVPEVVGDTEADENMSGWLNMTKSRLDNKKDGGFSVQNLVSVDKLASGLVSGVGSIAKFGMQGVKILG